MLKKTIALGFASLLLASPAWAAPDWSAVDRAIGRAGAEQPGGVYRYSFPRSDLSVTLDGVTIKPSLALGSWAAFQPMGDEAMVMGDLVLTHDEVNPVLSRLLASGFTITALHNHLLRSSPATMYMHIAGHGDPVKLAAALRQALSASRTPLAAPQSPSASAAASRLDLDVAALNRPVQFELTADVRATLIAWLERRGGSAHDYLFPSRVDLHGHMSTRQYARLVDEWVTAIGLRKAEYGTHSLRRTKAAMIYRATGNIRAIQILLGHTKIENTVRYLGVDLEDALLLAERTEI